MPDVFDSVSPDNNPGNLSGLNAPAPKGDVFDQVSAAPPSTAPPKEDIFDQISKAPSAPSNNPYVRQQQAQKISFAQSLPADYDNSPEAFVKAAGNRLEELQAPRLSQQRAADIQDQALAQAQQASEQKIAAYQQQHPVAGRIISGANAFLQAADETVGGTAGVVNPAAGQSIQQGVAISQPANPANIETPALRFAGHIAPALFAAGGGAVPAAIAMGAQGAGQSRVDVLKLRQQGQPVSGSGEALQATAQGLLQGGAALMFPGAPNPEAAAAGFVNKALQYGQGIGKAAVINTGIQLASNLIKRGVDPNAAITEGLRQAGGTGGLIQAVLGLHEPFVGKNPHQTNVEAREEAPPTQKPTEADHELIRSAGAQLEQTLRGKAGTEDFNRQKDLSQATQAEQTAQTPNEKAQARAKVLEATPPRFENTPASEGATAPGEIGTRNGPVSTPAETIQNSEGAARQVKPQENYTDKTLTPLENSLQGELPSESVKGQESTPNAEQVSSPAAARPGGRLQALADWTKGREVAKAAHADWQNQTRVAQAELGKLRESTPDLTTPGGQAFVDRLEKTGKSGNPEFDAVHQRLNADAIKAAKDAGTDTDAYNPFWFKRLARKPSSMSDTEYTRRLAGAEGYLKGRTQPTFSDFYKAMKAHGLELAYPNAADMQLAGLSEVHRSAAIGQQIQRLRQSGQALDVKPGEDAPAGYDRIDDLIGKHGENVAIPSPMAEAFRNIIGRSQGDIGKIHSSLRTFSYALDKMLAVRALAGYGGEVLSDPAHILSRGKNLATAYKVSRAPEILNEPRYAAIKAKLDTLAKTAGFNWGSDVRNPGETKPNAIESLGKAVAHGLPNAITKHITDPLRMASNLHLTDVVDQHPEWPQAKVDEFLKSGSASIDRLIGGENSPTGLPPVVDTTLRLLSPFWRYGTAGVRQGGAAVKDLVTGRPKIAAQKLVGALAFHALSNAVAQMVLTKYNTGTAIPPTQPMDLLAHRTGEKNSDGSDKRGSVLSSLFPTVAMFTEAAHGEPARAAARLLNPALPGIGEALSGRNSYNGQQLTIPQRAGHLAASFLFLPNIRNEQGEISPLAAVKGFVSPTRELPKAAERSSAGNYLADRLSDAPTRTTEGSNPENWVKWDSLAKTPADFAANRSQILQEMEQDPAIKQTTIKAAFKRWQSPLDMSRVAVNPRLSPDDLLHAYQLASPDEQDQLKIGIHQRARHTQMKDLSKEDAESWKALLTAVNQ